MRALKRNFRYSLEDEKPIQRRVIKKILLLQTTDINPLKTRYVRENSTIMSIIFGGKNCSLYGHTIEKVK